MKQKTLSLLKIIVKYVLPVILGWLEGDSHLIEDSMSSLF